ncbi:MAG: 7-cyano-7-deazaguanine synthase [Candidatus Nanohaloarchaea archaeon]
MKAFVLLSGGIDSAVCLQKAVNEFEEVEAIHFDYGQQTEEIERENAKQQCKEQGLNLHLIDYREVFAEFAEGTIRDQDYSSDNLSENQHSVGYVPQRNLHLLTSAAAKAEHETETGEEIALFFGAQAGDEEDYPDCRPEFVELAENAINESTEQHKVEIKTPLLDKSKTEVLQEGESLGVNWENTFSCYNDEEKTPCGECPACVERKEAFDKVGFEDPVLE